MTTISAEKIAYHLGSLAAGMVQIIRSASHTEARIYAREGLEEVLASDVPFELEDQQIMEDAIEKFDNEMKEEEQ